MKNKKNPKNPKKLKKSNLIYKVDVSSLDGAYIEYLVQASSFGKAEKMVKKKIDLDLDLNFYIINIEVLNQVLLS